LAHAMQADPLLRGVHLILVTSLHSQDELARARAAGIQGYLSKPVRRQELFRALSQAVGDASPQANAMQSQRSLPKIRARVLMAEDNGVNQVVARNMLKAMGCEFDIVPNGEEAWRAVQRGGYDIVLMDCQMPVMDGYDATRAIRAWEAEQSALTGPNAGQQARIPIVALTANALVGDAETCLAAGMNDHLAKPYSRKQLTSVVARWLPPHMVECAADCAAEEAASTPAAAPATATELAPERAIHAANSAAPVLDQAALNNIRALDDDGAVLVEVIQMYLDEVPQQLRGMAAALAAGQGTDLGRIAHALKSASFNVGAKTLGALCKDVERLGKANDMAGAAPLVSALQEQYEKLKPLLVAEMGVPA
jgi:two-component system, sensor histidine kinase and response regulator